MHFLLRLVVSLVSAGALVTLILALVDAVVQLLPHPFEILVLFVACTGGVFWALTKVGVLTRPR